jgi:hypothetical protein
MTDTETGDAHWRRGFELPILLGSLLLTALVVATPERATQLGIIAFAGMWGVTGLMWGRVIYG